MKPRVFIGSSSESLPAAYVLQQQLQGDATVNVWNQGVFGISQYTLDELLRATAAYDFAVFVFAADDTVKLRGRRYLVARDNVLLEMGLFVGRIGRERTFIVQQQTREPLHLPSDLQGIGTTAFDWTGSALLNADPVLLHAALGACSQAIRVGMKRAGPMPDQEVQTRIQGKRLFQHRGYYPIDLEPGTNRPSLNREVFCKAIRYLLRQENYDRLAATDLVYLREDNLVDGDILTDRDMRPYTDLVEKYELLRFIENFEAENRHLFRNYVRIVEDMGETLQDVFFEILLHNVRNPIRSIIAARNSEGISGRKLFDPSTRFVVQYVKNQGRLLMKAMEGGSKVRYLKQFSQNKQVKATTTPLYHDTYGLIGILCMNIDIDAVRALDVESRDRFFSAYVSNTGQTPKFEREDWELD